MLDTWFIFSYTFHSSYSSFLPFVFPLLPSCLLHLLPPPSFIFPFISPVVSTLLFLISLPSPLPVSSVHFFWETVFNQLLTVKSTKDVKHCQGGFTSSISFFFPSSQKEYRLLCLWDFPGKNTGVGCHFLLQGIFLTQESNLHLLCSLHWQADS